MGILIPMKEEITIPQYGHMMVYDILQRLTMAHMTSKWCNRHITTRCQLGPSAVLFYGTLT